MLLCIGVHARRQTMDLRSVTYPQIQYLHMGNAGPGSKEIRVNNLYMTLGGKPVLPVMGEFHYSRMNPRYWEDALIKMKASGVNIVSTYCLWSLHEEREGTMSWQGHLNLRRFLLLCQKHGLLVHLRIGPYCNAEIRNGGLPDWLVGDSRIDLRSNQQLYLEYVRRWYEAVFAQVKGLQYKDGGPVMAVQLENEYVRKGMVISHLTNLKRMAVQIGFDVPLYTMTHWMDSEYPHGEIVPYAGFYIEAPWTTSGREEMPTSNFEFFTYNRLSDNIATDIIKVEGGVKSLSGKENKSPFFTCEVGVGTDLFNHRRVVMQPSLTDEMVCLRLGSGVNLMGYYMYAGGTNPVGELRTYESSGPRVSYDYQAPIREDGRQGRMMPAVRRWNYLMNDFGSLLAPAVAYLPASCEKRENLQWAVRYNKQSGVGFLFCSNLLNRHTRPDFPGTEFVVQLSGETLRFPKVGIKDGTCFAWPFNLPVGSAMLKYATAQPICLLHSKDGQQTFYFGQTADIDPLFAIKGKKDIRIDMKADMEGRTIQVDAHTRIIILNAEEQQQLWKLKLDDGSEHVVFSRDWVLADDKNIYTVKEQEAMAQPKVKQLRPMEGAMWIRPVQDGTAQRQFQLQTLSKVQQAWLRMASDNEVSAYVNGKAVTTEKCGDYRRANVTDQIVVDINTISFNTNKGAVVAEVEIMLENGKRLLWHTDGTWTDGTNATPVTVDTGHALPSVYAPIEHLAVYEINVNSENLTSRLYLNYYGDKANAWQNGQLVADNYFNGEPWVIGLGRLPYSLSACPLTVRITGLPSANENIYFEKDVDHAQCVNPTLNQARVTKEIKTTL